MREIESREGLLQLIAPGPAPWKVLVVESLFYLRELCRMLPNAEISVVTIYEEVLELASYRALPVKWTFLDFRKERLPYEKGAFDLMLAEPCLTDALEPYELLTQLGRLLKDTGSLVTEFFNIRYWRVLEGLRQGCYPERQRRFYAKSEIVPLLNDAIFKEISFAPLKQDAGDGAREWVEMGFENFSDDLRTEKWMLKAGRSTAEVASLKGMFDAATRKRLSRLLHRIEYGVEAEKSYEDLWLLCREKMIFEDYLGDFAREVMVHPKALQELYGKARLEGMELAGSNF